MKTATFGYALSIGALLLTASCQSGTPVLYRANSAALSSNGFLERTGGDVPYKIAHSFKGTPDGQDPLAGLTALDDKLYGTTVQGGSGFGTVFSITVTGQEHVLYKFKGSGLGPIPSSALTALAGTLYGTTYFGGSQSTGCPAGCGTVYAITPSGHENELYRFAGSPDGYSPIGNMAKVNGTLYGVTYAGGNSGCSSYGCGTVFSITPAGQENVVYSFASGKNDGDHPRAGLLALNGTLYGTTEAGGAYGLGTVFSVTTSGKEKVLYSFKGNADGAVPKSTLVAVGNVLYGTTAQGGLSGKFCFGTCGTVYSLTTSGMEKILYKFKGGTDGSSPVGGLAHHNGALYGTTYYGTNYCLCGTIFQLTTSGQEKVLHVFKGAPDAGGPAGDLFTLNGILWGTSTTGGSDASYYNAGSGTVFRIIP